LRPTETLRCFTKSGHLNFGTEQKTLQPLDNPFGPKPVTDVSGSAFFYILGMIDPLLGRAEQSTPEARRGAPFGARG
jgi:hypothetical protein